MSRTNSWRIIESPAITMSVDPPSRRSNTSCRLPAFGAHVTMLVASLDVTVLRIVVAPCTPYSKKGLQTSVARDSLDRGLRLMQAACSQQIPACCGTDDKSARARHSPDLRVAAGHVRARGVIPDGGIPGVRHPLARHDALTARLAARGVRPARLIDLLTHIRGRNRTMGLDYTSTVCLRQMLDVLRCCAGVSCIWRQDMAAAGELNELKVVIDSGCRARFNFMTMGKT